MTSFLYSLSQAGCARLVAIGGAFVLSLACLGTDWREIPVEIEDVGRQTPDARAQASLAVDDLLAERSNLAIQTRRRVARAIVEEAAAAHFDPVFVLSVIGVESDLDGNAVSSVGARGLMQLRENTEMYLSEKDQLGLGPETALDPALNVRVGIRYLARLHRAFGNWSLALVAYNAGPHRLSGFLHSGGVPERFNEYPRRVRAHYRRLLNQVSDGTLRVNHPLRIPVATR